jgi:YggT family protein
VFVVSNLLYAVAHILNIVLTIYIVLLVIRALLSWVRPDLLGPVTNFMYATTEPILHPLRRRFGLSAGGVDFTPLAVLLLILFIKYFVVESLFDAAARLH